MSVFARKRRLNRVFEEMDLSYANCDDPSTRVLFKDAVPHGQGTRGRRSGWRQVTAGHGASTAALESCKRNHGGRGRDTAEPTDICIGREIASKVGNNKKVVIRQARRFGQFWTKMVVLPFTLLTFVLIILVSSSCLSLLLSFGSCIYALLPLLSMAASNFDGMGSKAKVGDVNDTFGTTDTMSVTP